MCVQGEHASLVCTRKYCKLKIEFNHSTEFEAYKDLIGFFKKKNWIMFTIALILILCTLITKIHKKIFLVTDPYFFFNYLEPVD